MGLIPTPSRLARRGVIELFFRESLEKVANLGQLCRVRSCASHQVNRSVTTGIFYLCVGAFGKQVAHQFRLAFLRRDVKCRSAFIRGRRAGDAHGVRQRPSDLSIDIGAVLEQQFHHFLIHGTPIAAVHRKTGGTGAVAGADSSRNEKWCEACGIDIGIRAFRQERSNDLRITACHPVCDFC